MNQVPGNILNNGALAALSEVPGSVPRSYMVANNHLYLGGTAFTQMRACTHAQTLIIIFNSLFLSRNPVNTWKLTQQSQEA